MMLDAAFWLAQVGTASRVLLLAIGVLGLVRYRQLPRGLRWLVGLVWFGLAIETGAMVLRHWHRPNLLLIPLDAAGELWLLSLVFAWGLGSAKFSRWRPWVAGGFVLYAALSTALVPEAARFKPDLLVVECLLVLGMAGLYFRKVLRELQVSRLAHDPMFWVAAGLLLYGLGKLQIALFSNYLLAHYSRSLNLWVWTIHGLLLIVLYGCYGRALWMRPQK